MCTRRVISSALRNPLYNISLSYQLPDSSLPPAHNPVVPSIVCAMSSNTQPSDINELSFFVHKYKITSFKSDIFRWNRDWDEVLRTLSSKEVHSALAPFWQPITASGHAAQLAQEVQKLETAMRQSQGILVEAYDLEDGKIQTPWLLLAEKERKRHLLQGLGDACQSSTLGQDSRAMCPEIIVRVLLKQNGKKFIHLLEDVVKGKKELGEDGFYKLPNEWWDVDLNTEVPSQPDTEYSHALLTVQRNEFITKFLLSTLSSVLKDLSEGSPGMNPVLDILKGQSMGCSKVMADTLSSMHSASDSPPLIRCENCTKSAEEIIGHPKFSVCSKCKSKLNFDIHYCSQACQRTDWPRHKKQCGKSKISKQLKGTVHDPFRGLPDDMSDYMRKVLPPDTNAGGGVPINSVGFSAPSPGVIHSPALQRQISLLEGDKEADYFLFDEVERPIRFQISDMFTKMQFRIMRAGIFSEGKTDIGLECMVEYLLKMMSHYPGLNRERIIAQLTREYGEELPRRLAAWDKIGEKKGLERGVTLLEDMSKKMSSTLPTIMGLHPEIMGRRR